MAGVAEWFRREREQVNEIDRRSFIEAVKKLHNGEAAKRRLGIRQPTTAGKLLNKHPYP